jgi:hypothetical protein
MYVQYALHSSTHGIRLLPREEKQVSRCTSESGQEARHGSLPRRHVLDEKAGLIPESKDINFEDGNSNICRRVEYLQHSMRNIPECLSRILNSSHENLRTRTINSYTQLVNEISLKNACHWNALSVSLIYYISLQLKAILILLLLLLLLLHLGYRRWPVSVFKRICRPIWLCVDRYLGVLWVYNLVIYLGICLLSFLKYCGVFGQSKNSGGRETAVAR